MDSYYGIEYEEFPAEIARVALWLTDHQANMALSAEFGQPFVRLPLQHSPNIVHGNALRLDWAEVLGGNPSGREGASGSVAPPEAQRDTLPNRRVSAFLDGLYILGNPLFLGKKEQNQEQKADMEMLFGGVKGSGVLDYVSAWYLKAAQLIQKTQVRAAFVSTNSIVQGEQVGILWSLLINRFDIKIHFAHRSFKWRNEAKGNAAVYCVVVGFGNFDTTNKTIFEYENYLGEPNAIKASNINPYLVDSQDFVLQRRSTPICSPGC